MQSRSEIELPSEHNTLNIGIALYDPDNGDILDANDRFETVLGYATERLCELAVSLILSMASTTVLRAVS